jgi:hypothetical protein
MQWHIAFRTAPKWRAVRPVLVSIVLHGSCQTKFGCGPIRIIQMTMTLVRSGLTQLSFEGLRPFVRDATMIR